jgi:hypothetical protein
VSNVFSIGLSCLYVPLTLSLSLSASLLFVFRSRTCVVGAWKGRGKQYCFVHLLQHGGYRTLPDGLEVETLYQVKNATFIPIPVALHVLCPE